jgi:hypothetical protein
MVNFSEELDLAAFLKRLRGRHAKIDERHFNAYGRYMPLAVRLAVPGRGSPFGGSMRIGDVTVHPLIDGVVPMPPGLLYPDVPRSVWQSQPGTIDQDGMLQIPFGGFPGHR